MNQEYLKLDRFFFGWKDKLMFLLTDLKISYILDSNLPALFMPTPKDNK